ncbi:MAG: MerR family transcriptional regulator [Rhodospirillaceae bacterium]|nr:MerR family transcriptional regulator [Rhodospirillaceae bacterium]
MTATPQSETYTDEQVTTATGLHVDNLRKLITWGAVRPAQGGGGRGRVRKWTTRQALRIAITAHLVDAGFSLQMAHTVTYCLPLDDLLHAYDPAMMRAVAAKSKDQWDAFMLQQLTDPSQPDLPNDRYLGSLTVLVDGRYLYSDCLGDSPYLMAVIDQGASIVYPTWSSPYTFQYGSGTTEELDLPRTVDAAEIERSSLLINEKYLRPRKGRTIPTAVLPKGVPHQIIAIDDIVCKTLVVINLALSLLRCVRSLQGLPIEYQPHERRRDDQ